MRSAGCVFAEDEADLLCAESAAGPQRAALVARRVAGEPLEYVLGWAEFAGLRIAVTAGVFVPRRRTEFLAAQAAARLPPDGRALDLCCGSGAVGRVLLVAGARDLLAVDIDPRAVECAAGNLADSRARIYHGDLFSPLPIDLIGRIDVIAVNAPYVPTAAIGQMPVEARLYEARVALDGGEDGLDVQRRVAAEAARWLRPGGSLLIETSDDQAERTAQLLTGGALTATIMRSGDLDATVVIGTAVH